LEIEKAICQTLNLNCSLHFLLIMTTHVPISICEVPDVNRLPNREKRQVFRSATYRTTIIEDLANIDVGGKTVKNRARSGGTDNINTENLYGEFECGIRYDQLPPIVSYIDGVLKLIDGFTRFRALTRRGQVSWAFDVYDLNPGYTVEDLFDEIGLGANSHPASKSAEDKDFVTRGINWVNRQERLISPDEIRDWVNSIHHTFSQQKVNGIVKKIHSKVYPDKSIRTFTSDEVEEYLSVGGYTSGGKLDDDGFAGRTICAEPNGTYVPRNFSHILKDVAKGRRSKIHLYIPSGKTADKATELIDTTKDEILELWDAVKLCSLKLKEDRNWTPFEFGVRPSQIVDVDPDGGVVPL
jgi:hypothetical protein